MRSISACVIGTALIGVSWLCAADAASSEEIRPADPTRSPTVSGYPAMVLQSMLQQMGLELPPESRGGRVPKPEPEPPPPEEDEDDFFDDDFFDDDVGFDDMVDRMDEEFDETVKAWDEEYEKQVEKWEKARAVYLEQESRYKSATIPLEAPSSSPGTSLRDGGDLSSGVEAMQPGEFHLIPNAMSLPVRDQKGRGTCTAFSGVRALETLMMQHGFAADFSEQHFYFLSKPGCMEQPCDSSREGSSVDAGLKATQTSPIALVTETDCPYIESANKSNITFTPLSGCRANGVVRAGELRQLQTLDQVLAELRNNRPIVVGFSVDDSYGRNRGLVRYYDPEAASREGGGGHANLLIGYIKLPPSLAREGGYCVITVNSWNPGWGRGGYACLTETWLRKSFQSAVAVRSAVMTEAGLEYYGFR